MTEPTPCLLVLRKLKEAIDARMTGTGVQSVGHKGRTLEYATMNVGEMMKYYMQLWRQCPAAQAELPELQPLDGPTGTRGRPAIFVGSGRV
jgi:hypothetical protein